MRKSKINAKNVKNVKKCEKNAKYAKNAKKMQKNAKKIKDRLGSDEGILRQEESFLQEKDEMFSRKTKGRYIQLRMSLSE